VQAVGQYVHLRVPPGNELAVQPDPTIAIIEGNERHRSKTSLFGTRFLDLSKLTSLSKQAASKTLADLQRLSLAQKASGDLDARRRPAELTPEGIAFEYRVAERLRTLLGRAYRTGGLDGVAGARRILAALAGPRQGVGLNRRGGL
jgi:DNA-binding MarR family transcriptional regulator